MPWHVIAAGGAPVGIASRRKHINTHWSGIVVAEELDVDVSYHLRPSQHYFTDHNCRHRCLRRKLVRTGCGNPRPGSRDTQTQRRRLISPINSLRRIALFPAKGVNIVLDTRQSNQVRRTGRRVEGVPGLISKIGFDARDDFDFGNFQKESAYSPLPHCPEQCPITDELGHFSWFNVRRDDCK